MLLLRGEEVAVHAVLHPGRGVQLSVEGIHGDQILNRQMLDWQTGFSNEELKWEQ